MRDKPAMKGDIVTPRLVLRLMHPKLARAGLKGDLRLAERHLDAQISPELIQQPEVLRLLLDRHGADPDYGPWGPRAMILRHERRMVGHIGFHSQPDPEYLHPYTRGAVELGYSVFRAHQRQGYAAEALHAVMDWAHHHHGVSHFVAAVAPDNHASVGLLTKFGFARVGEHDDPVDGAEHIFLRRSGLAPA